MIDCAAVEKQIRSDLEHVQIDYEDLKAVDSKIGACKDIIKELENRINHAYGIHKVLLEWHLRTYQESLVRCEILRKIIGELYLKKN